jgi:hypothetical protein
MPFSPQLAMRNLSTWPAKSKSPPMARSRQTSVDLKFGVPSPDDPDPFGVRALEEAGLMIKEAGSHSRPSSEAFEFRPSPSSPVFRNSFQSFDGISKRDSRRESRRSNLSVDQGTQTADLPSPLTEQEPVYMSPTQMAAAVMPSPIRENERIEAWSADVRRNEEQEERQSDGKLSATHRTSPLRESWTAGDATYHDAGVDAREEVDAAPAAPPARQRSASQRLSETLDQLERESLPRTAEQSPTQSNADEKEELEKAKEPEDDEEAEDEEEPEVGEVVVEQVVQAPTAVKVMSSSMVSPTVARAKLVTIKGRPAPAIPARNPARHRRARAVNADGTADHLTAEREDESSSAYSLSPTRSAFDRSDDHASNQWSEQTSLPDESSDKSRRESVGPADESNTNVVAEGDAETTEDDHSTQKQSEEQESMEEDSKLDTSLADTVALALTPTNDSQLSNLPESKDVSQAEDSVKPTGIDEPTTPHASTILALTTDTHLTTTSEAAPPQPDTLADDKSPLTPHAPQGAFSQPTATLHPNGAGDAEVASVSDYDAHSQLDNESQNDGEDDAFHSMPQTPFNESEQPEVHGLGLHTAPTAPPVVGGVV